MNNPMALITRRIVALLLVGLGLPASFGQQPLTPLPFSDDFEPPQSAGHGPDARRWTEANSARGSLIISTNAFADGRQSLQITHNSSANPVTFRSAGKLVNPNGGQPPVRLGYSLSVMPQQTTSRLTFSARDSNQEKVCFEFGFDRDGKIKWIDGGGTNVLMSAYPTNRFVRVEALVDLSTRLYSATVGGVDVAVSRPLAPKDPRAKQIDCFRVLTDASATGTFFLDAVSLREIPPVLPPLAAATYYVDNVNGDDSNRGTSTNAPWRTLWKVKNTVFSDGSQILFRRGGMWLESLVAPRATAGPKGIVLGDYGAPTAPRPRIGSLVDIGGSGIQLLINPGMEQVSGAPDDNAPDFFEGWSFNGLGQSSASAVFSGRRSCRLNAGTTMSQDVQMGLGGTLNVSLAGKMGATNGCVEVRLLQFKTDGSVTYLNPSGGWTTNPVSFTRFISENTNWNTYSSPVFSPDDWDKTQYQYQLQLIAGSNSFVYVDDVKLNSSWDKMDPANNIYRLNVGAMSGPLLADWSGGNNLQMAPPNRNRTWQEPARSVDKAVDYRSYCLLLRDNDGGNKQPSGHLEAAALDYAALVMGKKNVTLQSLDISGGRFWSYPELAGGGARGWFPFFQAWGSGLGIIGCSNLVVKDCHVHGNGGANIALAGSGDFAADVMNHDITIKDCKVYQAVAEGMRCQGSKMLITGNEVYENGRYSEGDGGAIGVYSGSRYVTVSHNNVHDNGSNIAGLDAGICAYNVNDVTFCYNYVHDNYHGGMYAAGWHDVTGVNIYGNLIINNGRSTSIAVNHNGLAILLTTGAQVNNNIVVGNNCYPDPGAVWINWLVSSLTFKNNIVMNNVSSNAQLYVGKDCDGSFDNNIYWGTTNMTPVVVNWRGTTYSADQESQYRAAHETNAFFRDPPFVNLPAGR